MKTTTFLICILISFMGLWSEVIRVSSAPVVTSGSCSTESKPTNTYCVNNSQLTLNGTDLPTYSQDVSPIPLNKEKKIYCQLKEKMTSSTSITCTLLFNASDKTMPIGEEQITLFWDDNSKKEQSVSAGYIITADIGKNYSGWYNTSPPVDRNVTAVINTSFLNNDNMFIIGSYSTNHIYYVSLIDESVGKANSTPNVGTVTCINVAVYENYIKCTLNASSVHNGSWLVGVLEQNTGLLDNSFHLPSIQIAQGDMPLYITAGDCLVDSKKCVNNAALLWAFNADNNGDLPSNWVKITFGNSSKIQSLLTGKVEYVINSSGSVVEQKLEIQFKEANPPPHGVYAINVQYKYTDKGVWTEPYTIANFIMGVFIETEPGVQTNLSSYDTFYVSAAAPEIVHDQEIIYISGSFNTSSNYTVLVVPDNSSNSNTKSVTTTEVLPSCKIIKLTAKVISCRYVGVLRSLLHAKVFIKDAKTNVFLQLDGTAVPSLTLYPVAPIVTSVSGSCAENNKNCVTGSSLTIHGNNFNVTSPESNRINIKNTTDISCKPVSVTATNLTCELHLSSNKNNEHEKLYALTLQTLIDTQTWYTPEISIGWLNLKKINKDQGWIQGNGVMELRVIYVQRSYALVGCAIFFAILLLITIIIYIITFTCFKVVKRN